MPSGLMMPLMTVRPMASRTVTEISSSGLITATALPAADAVPAVELNARAGKPAAVKVWLALVISERMETL